MGPSEPRGCGCGGARAAADVDVDAEAGGGGARRRARRVQMLVGCAARSAASGKRKRPPAQRKIFGFHNPHYRFPDTELSGIRARAPRQNTDFVAGISDFWRSEAVSAPQAKILRFRRPKVTILSRFQRSLESHPASGPEDPIFLPIFLSEKSQIIV